MHITTLSPSISWWYKNGIPSPTNEIWINHALKIGTIPNQDHIFSQHLNLVKELEKIANVQVLNIWFPDKNNTEIKDNSVFIRDAFLSNQKDKILISRFRNPSRINQSQIIGEMIKKKLETLSIYRDIVTPPNEKNLYFEGGDFRYNQMDNILSIWFNPDKNTSRNSETGIKWVQHEMNIPDNNCIYVHSKWFHIDTVLWLVTNTNGKIVACLACPDLISNYDDVVNQYTRHGIQMLPIDSKYGINSPASKIQGLWTVNTLNINEYLISGGKFDNKTEDLLEELGIKRRIVNVSEFWLAGGWVHCLTNQI